MFLLLTFLSDPGAFPAGKADLVKKGHSGQLPRMEGGEGGTRTWEGTPIITVGVSARQALVEVLDENELDHPARAVIFLLQEP